MEGKIIEFKTTVSGSGDVIERICCVEETAGRRAMDTLHPTGIIDDGYTNEITSFSCMTIETHMEFSSEVV